jgi:hypothetical protein
MKNVFKNMTRLLFLLLFCDVASAQSLVSTIFLNDVNLSVVESERYTNLQQDSFTKDLTLVNFGNPRDFVNVQGILQFEFPGIQGVIEAQVIDIVQTDTSYSWTGRLLNHTGYFGFYEILGQRAAWLQIDTRFFEIMPIKSGISTVREIEGNVFDSVDCLNPKGEKSVSAELNLCANDYNTCTATIDILVLLPPDATDWLETRFGDNWLIKALYVGIGTQSLNTAFINSDIPNKKANIILENFNMVYPPNIGCSSLLDALVSQATARRNAIGADLVMLLTANADYSCGAGAACAELGDVINCDPSFAFTEIWWLIHPRWTFIHEIGHLMGAGHNRPDDDDSDCAHGWTVGGNRFQKTSMARWNGSQNPTDTRILHYSNPDVVFNGDPTGTENDNNAKVIRNGACIVANYRHRFVFDARISSDDPWYCRSDEYFQLMADVQQPIPIGSPGMPPYTYEWRWNYSGNFSGSNSTYIGNTEFVTFPIPSGDHVWVLLKVTSSDGLTVTKQKNIGIYEDDDPRCDIFKSAKRGFQFTSALLLQKLLVVPNPANSTVQVTWGSDLEGEATIHVIDGLGRICTSRILRQVIGENIIHLDSNAFTEGIYTISLRTQSGILAQKLLIVH